MSFQVPFSNAHVTSCTAHIHKPKKALETKVNEIKGRDKKSNKNKSRWRKNCDVISTIFFAIFLQESHQNLMWKIVTGFNLNPLLKLFFYSSILANNNLLLKIYCENIVVVFLNCHLLILNTKRFNPKKKKKPKG